MPNLAIVNATYLARQAAERSVNDMFPAVAAMLAEPRRPDHEECAGSGCPRCYWTGRD